MTGPEPDKTSPRPSDPVDDGTTPRLRGPRRRPAGLFDARDYELVELVQEFRTVGKNKKPELLRRLFNPSLHPRGFKELSATHERRLAYAVIRLLDSLEQDDAHDRIVALRALHDEALLSSRSGLQKNTARVLLTVMKELVREEYDYWRQVELAHDFYAAVAGRPGEVRRQLRKYHLIEMPEQWNQVAFDHHVHDAHTKGRKTPTHLVMDAWIKGIRELTVVYYYYWTAGAVAELIEAAEIMGVKVNPGLEFSARCHDKYIRFIWIPRGLETAADFQSFIEKPTIRPFMEQGHEVARVHADYVLALLRCFNQKHRQTLNQRYDLNLPELSEEEFRAAVGVGQPSVTLLAEFIHQRCVERARPVVADMARRARQAPEAEAALIRTRLQELDELVPSIIAERWLGRSSNPEIPHPDDIRDGNDVPELLRLTTRELVDKLTAVRAGSHLVLNLTGLTPADVLEALYHGRGAVTHLELFNLKDFVRQRTPHLRAIAELRQVLNSGNVILLKRIIRDAIREVEESDRPCKEERLAGLHQVLTHLLDVASLYGKVPLRTSIGSDSIGRAQSLYGMGLVVADTLPRRSRRAFLREPDTRAVLPLHTETELHTVTRPHASPVYLEELIARLLRRLPGLREFGFERHESFELVPSTTHVVEPGTQGNILTIGGIEKHPCNGFGLEPPVEAPPGCAFGRLNTKVRNVGKVLVGFLPAFLTFFLTKNWWVLAWLGAPIWFAITGLRNVLQSVVGGGGVRRSNLLSWRDLVSWERVADSLLYTGFSVPLLDWLIKDQLLRRGMDITTATAPLLLYSVMALANGIYLFSHNTARGLPQAAAVGNLFRSVLAIPIAFGLNAGVRWIMIRGGMTALDADAMMQNWAAIVTKAASDMVAGIIEGSADRSVNVRTRLRDYRTKIRFLLRRHGELEAAYPEQDILKLLESPKEFVKAVDDTQRDLAATQVVNSLDMMYFWMMQPRARLVFRRLMRESAPAERTIVLRTQRLLERKRFISRMMLDGLVGKNFAPGLAFYLDKSPAYLRDMARLAAELGADGDRPASARD